MKLIFTSATEKNRNNPLGLELQECKLFNTEQTQLVCREEYPHLIP